MKYAIVYSSQTGNTQQLANSLLKALGEENCVYFGMPGKEALEADRIYVGFWTNQGTCDQTTRDFLKTVTGRQIFLFGTAGFGGSREYYDQIIARVSSLLPESAVLLGSYMCQGKMPASVREKYEKLQKLPGMGAKMGEMLKNFDQALSHPNDEDLLALKTAVQSCI